MTRWRIVDQLRKRVQEAHHRPERDQLTRTGTAERLVDPASLDLNKMWEAEWEKSLLEAAVDKVRHRIDPRKYQIFDCYVNKEWAAEKVARTFGVSVDQVYLAKHRVTESIKEEVRRLEKEVT